MPDTKTKITDDKVIKSEEQWRARIDADAVRRAAREGDRASLLGRI
ncbi:hypothetical protein ACVIM7_006624 [Bradyrhizobium liaoningense]